MLKAGCSAARIALVATAALLGQTASVPDIRGLYVVSNDVSKFNQTRADQLRSAIATPGIDGLYLLISWSAIEPARGQFRWDALDMWLGLAVSGGKRVDLAILGGNSSPAWLYDPIPAGAGAAKLTFSYAIQGGKLGQCIPIVMAPPWDAAFLAEWDTMLSSLANHLKSTGAYSSIAMLRLTGINVNTDELKLPQETPQGNSLACLTDAPMIWQQAGYRPSLVLSAWDRISTSFQNAFPDKSYAVGLTETNAFPPIDETGAIVTGQNSEQTLPEVKLASQKFGVNLITVQTFLLPGMPPHQEIITAAQTLHSQAAFQTNEWLGLAGGAACGGLVTAPVACDGPGFISMIEGGIYPLGKANPLRAPFIELFAPSVLTFAGTLPGLLSEIIPASGPPLIAAGGVVLHGGSSSTVSPGSLIDIYASGLPSVAATAPAGPLPSNLGGTMALINGMPAPLIYAGPQQVVAQVPYELATGPASVVLWANGVSSAAVPIQIGAAAPGILTYGGNHGVVQNQDYSVNSSSNGAAPGSTAMAYLTGSGPVSPPVATGLAAPVTPLSLEQLSTSVTVGGTDTAVVFAGLGPGLIGIAQVNFMVPRLPPGDYSLQIGIGGVASNSAQFTIAR